MTFNASMGHALKPDCAIKPRSDGLIHVSIAHPFYPPSQFTVHYAHGRKSAKSCALNQLANMGVGQGGRPMMGGSGRPAKSGQKLIKPLRAVAANESSANTSQQANTHTR